MIPQVASLWCSLLANLFITISYKLYEIFLFLIQVFYILINLYYTMTDKQLHIVY